MWLPCRIIPLIILLAAFTVGAWAQNIEDSKSPFPKFDQDKEAAPKNFQETLEKMRIEKDKKDHDEMIDRGDEALKITDQLEKSVEQTGKLSNKDIAKLARIEKLAKKIREELGGSNDDDKYDDETGMPSLADAVKNLRTSTGTLYDELKKTTRFTISAAAIQSTNMVLRLTRMLKLTK